eukprot:Nk52_evm42s224 gene=Nk52_evmTU42s224
MNKLDEPPNDCPLCMEPLDLADKSFYPCTCGYQICRFCWHHIRNELNGLCPACRKEYEEQPAEFTPLSAEDFQEIKDRKRKKEIEKKQKEEDNRKHLSNVRVIQRNLVYVIGLSLKLADEDTIRRQEYFGQYGKILKVVVNKSNVFNASGGSGPTVSAYITFANKGDALKTIQAVDGATLDGKLLRASFGTTKYCTHFLRNNPCPNPDCMYLHEMGEEAVSVGKEDSGPTGFVQFAAVGAAAGHSSLIAGGSAGANSSNEDVRRLQGYPGALKAGMDVSHIVQRDTLISGSSITKNAMTTSNPELSSTPENPKTPVSDSGKSALPASVSWAARISGSVAKEENKDSSRTATKEKSMDVIATRTKQAGESQEFAKKTSGKISPTKKPQLVEMKMSTQVSAPARPVPGGWAGATGGTAKPGSNFIPSSAAGTGPKVEFKTSRKISALGSRKTVVSGAEGSVKKPGEAKVSSVVSPAQRPSAAPVVRNEVEGTASPEKLKMENLSLGRPANESSPPTAVSGRKSRQVDDDFGFDPWKESYKGLADLLEDSEAIDPSKRNGGKWDNSGKMVEREQPGAWPEYNVFNERRDGPQGPSRMPHPSPSPAVSKSRLPPPGIGMPQERPFPLEQPFGMPLGMPPMSHQGVARVEGNNEDGHKDWQEGFRALFPNVNISFSNNSEEGGDKTSQKGESSQPMGPMGREKGHQPPQAAPGMPTRGSFNEMQGGKQMPGGGNMSFSSEVWQSSVGQTGDSRSIHQPMNNSYFPQQSRQAQPEGGPRRLPPGFVGEPVKGPTQPGQQGNGSANFFNFSPSPWGPLPGGPANGGGPPQQQPAGGASMGNMPREGDRWAMPPGMVRSSYASNVNGSQSMQGPAGSSDTPFHDPAIMASGTAASKLKSHPPGLHNVGDNQGNSGINNMFY